MLLTIAAIAGVLGLALIALTLAGRRRGLSADSPPPVAQWPQPAQLETAYRKQDFEGGACKVWFDRPRPDGGWRCLTVGDEDVVGEEYQLAALRSFLFGSDHEIRIVRETTNAADPDALVVEGRWTVGGVAQSGPLGYLPGRLAAEVALTRPAGMEIRATPETLFFADTILDLQVALFEPSEASGYWTGAGLTVPAPIENLQAPGMS